MNIEIAISALMRSQWLEYVDLACVPACARQIVQIAAILVVVAEFRKLGGILQIPAGVGPGNGTAFTRKFAGEGYRVAMLARSADRLEKLEREVPGSKGYQCDLADSELRFIRIREDLDPPRCFRELVGGNGVALSASMR